MLPTRHAAVGSALVVAAFAAGAAVAATPGSPVVATERSPDAATGAPDLVRVALQRSSDGRLRASMTFAKAFTATSLVAKSGPPGSACLRVYTAATPGVLPPDYLVCVTADAKGRSLRASVLAEQVNKLPRQVATATVTRASSRSLSLRFSQSSVGRPPVIRFAAEATRPGCSRSGCVDTLPDAPATKKLLLRLEAPPER